MRWNALTTGLMSLGVAGSASAQLADRPLLIEASVPKAPTIASGSSGDFLLYELHVTSFERGELAWRSVEVSDPSSGTLLHAWADSVLWRDIIHPGAGTVALADRPRLGAGQRAVLFVRVPLPEETRPGALGHRLTFADSVGTRTIELQQVPVSASVAVIGPPLRGGVWLAANGPANRSGHRRALIPIGGTAVIAQRYAIDYVLVDTSYKTSTSERLRNESYFAHNAEVIAVADGIVASVKDGIPENVPGEHSRAVPITLETIGGNYVILDIGNGRYAFYAHLRPGSLLVKPGDRVTRGAPLARLGNSGNSTEPHLHFHLSDAASPLGSDGIPYVHDSLELVGSCRAFLSDCALRAPASRNRVMPLENELVRFPR